MTTTSPQPPVRKVSANRPVTWLALVTILLSAMTPSAVSAQPASAPLANPASQLGWTQIWNDEFSGTGAVDPANWLYDLGTSYPGGAANWGTGEVETMTNSTNNVFRDGAGHLVIKAIHTGTDPNTGWTSGRIETQRNDFQPPTGGALAIEASIQQPNVTTTNGLGYWPAFWALGGPFRGNYNNWPSVGEFDILEDINGRSSVFATFHCGPSIPGTCNETTGLGSGEHACPGCQTAYHTYRFEWDKSVTPNQLRWYLDGTNYFTISQNTVDASTWTNATNHGYMIILNLAMGGGFPGAFGGGPNAATISGGQMNVDYVRVFTANPCPTCPTPTNTPTPTTAPSTPYLGSPVALPGTIQAENFDLGGEGVGFHETTTGNQGGYAYRTDQASSGNVDIANNCNVCVNYNAPSEWLRYAVSVATAGTYTFNFRHAGPGGGVFHVETTSGQNLTGAITQPNTGSWDTYATYSQSVSLPAGNYGIKLVFDSCSGCDLNNVDWISFTGGTGPTNTPTRTNTPVAPTATPTRTNTPVAPTATPTRTNTPVGPTATFTRTPTRTNTPVVPTNTPTRTPTATATSTGSRDAYATIQAESYNAQSGTTTETTTDTGGGQDVTNLANGDWLQFNNVNFGGTSPINVQARVASGAAGGVSGLVEFHLDSVTGPLLGSFALSNTGGWQTWTTIPANIGGATGTHNLFVVFKSGQPANFVSVNWFVFVH